MSNSCPHSGIAVILVFGLPAAGKTNLLHQIKQHFEGSLKCENDAAVKTDRHLFFFLITDEMILKSEEEAAVASGNWKELKRRIMDSTMWLVDNLRKEDPEYSVPTSTQQAYVYEKIKNSRQLLKYEKNDKYVIFVEDNLYYKSMRYDWLRICRQKRIGFGGIFVDSPIEQCLEWNKKRREILPENTLLNMNSVFERPCVDEFFGNLIVKTSKSPIDYKLLDKMVNEILSSPLEPSELESQKQEDQEKTLRNIAHQFDLLLRTAIKISIAEQHLNAVAKQHLAQSLSLKKFQLVQEVKNSSLVLPDWMKESLTSSFQSQDSAGYDKCIQFCRHLLTPAVERDSTK